MTKVKLTGRRLAILLQAYKTKVKTGRHHQPGRQTALVKTGQKRIAQLLKDSEDGSDYQLEQFFSSYDWLE